MWLEGGSEVVRGTGQGGYWDRPGWLEGQVGVVRQAGVVTGTGWGGYRDRFGWL